MMTVDTDNRSVIVHPNELPICCPTPNMPLWNQHPRVYLPLQENGQATCPYCSRHYILAESLSSEPS